MRVPAGVASILCAIAITLAADGVFAVAAEAYPPAGRPETPGARQNASAASVATPPVSARDFENQPLNLTPPNPQRRAQQAPDRQSAFPSILPVLVYVALICGFFIFALQAARKYLPGHRRLFSHPAMEILGRAHVDQKRYVSLLRVGKRILVVGVSPDEMTSLSEITDEAEITEIMEVARPRTEAGLTIFQRLFQKNVIEADEEAKRHALEAKAEEKARELDDGLSSLRERVRSIRSMEEPAERLDITG